MSSKYTVMCTIIGAIFIVIFVLGISRLFPEHTKDASRNPYSDEYIFVSGYNKDFAHLQWKLKEIDKITKDNYLGTLMMYKELLEVEKFLRNTREIKPGELTAGGK